MRSFSAEDVRRGLAWPDLINALRDGFKVGATQPMRQHLDAGTPELEGNLLIMPAWQAGRFIGVKLVTVFPANAEKGLPSIASVYTLFDGENGQVLAQIDGGELTARRTAAASVLAATYLARPESRALCLFGTGRVALNLVQAYASAFALARITVVSRTTARAEEFCRALDGLGPDLVVSTDANAALAEADLVCAASLGRDAVVLGRHLKPGAHVDLVGAFRPDMREADDDTFRRAGGAFVDTYPGATKEAGDIVQAIASGALSEDRLHADLRALCCGEHTGRKSNSEITVFKSVGAAIEDLAAAVALYKSGG